jgi:hypothetical protein
MRPLDQNEVIFSPEGRGGAGGFGGAVQAGKGGGTGGGGKATRQIRKQSRPGQFGRQDRPREQQEYSDNYEKFKEAVLEPIDFEADDEEVIMLLIQMVGEL